MYIQDDFIGSVLNSGILVYLTPEFMAEVYQGVLVQDIIGNAGFNVNADSNAPMSSCAFINLLTGKSLVSAGGHIDIQS